MIGTSRNYSSSSVNSHQMREIVQICVQNLNTAHICCYFNLDHNWHDYPHSDGNLPVLTLVSVVTSAVETECKSRRTGLQSEIRIPCQCN